MKGDDLSTSLRLNVRSWICYIFLACILVIEAIKIKFKPNQENVKKHEFEIIKKDNRKVQGVQQSQTAANPRHKEEEKNDKNNTYSLD